MLTEQLEAKLSLLASMLHSNGLPPFAGCRGTDDFVRQWLMNALRKCYYKVSL